MRRWLRYLVVVALAGAAVAAWRPVEGLVGHLWAGSAVPWWCLLAVILVVAYLVVVVWHARYTVDGSPRKDMFICDKHGPMPGNAVFTLFDEPMDHMVEGKMRRAPVKICPLCYNNAINVARSREKVK